MIEVTPVTALYFSVLIKLAEFQTELYRISCKNEIVYKPVLPATLFLSRRSVLFFSVRLSFSHPAV